MQVDNIQIVSGKRQSNTSFSCINPYLSLICRKILKLFTMAAIDCLLADDNKKMMFCRSQDNDVAASAQL